MVPVVEVRDVCKSYGETRVIDSATFRVPRGSCVAVTGASGSGKSTLFKLLAGLDRATSGEILVEGKDITKMDDRAISELRLRRIGIVFQSLNLLPDLTLAENVRLPLDIAGAPRRAATDRAKALMELVGIAHRGDQLPHVLSGGEAQRGAIARALANDPAILLADEPTASLDRGNARTVMNAFRAAQADLGTTLLIITHDVALLGAGTPTLTMADGRVQWETPPERSHELQAI